MQNQIILENGKKVLITRSEYRIAVEDGLKLLNTGNFKYERIVLTLKEVILKSGEHVSFPHLPMHSTNEDVRDNPENYLSVTLELVLEIKKTRQEKIINTFKRVSPILKGVLPKL